MSALAPGAPFRPSQPDNSKHITDSQSKPVNNFFFFFFFNTAYSVRQPLHNLTLMRYFFKVKYKTKLYNKMSVNNKKK